MLRYPTQTYRTLVMTPYSALIKSFILCYDNQWYLFGGQAFSTSGTFSQCLSSFCLFVVIAQWFISYYAFHGSTQWACELANAHTFNFLLGTDSLHCRTYDAISTQQTPYVISEGTKVLGINEFDALRRIISKPPSLIQILVVLNRSPWFAEENGWNSINRN